MNLDIGLLDRETCLGSENLIFNTGTSQEYSTMPIIEEPVSHALLSRTAVRAYNS
jgi:hypothetical protein